MRIFTHTLGPFETNCYLVADDASDHCWIIDASFDPAPLLDDIASRRLHPEALILTHAHADHIAGVADVRAAFPRLPILIHVAERDWLNDPVLNLSAGFGIPITAPGPDRTLADGDSLRLGGSPWTVLHTPGHSPGGISLHCPAAMIAIVGDSLFAGSIGRTDFPGSSFETLEASIREKLYTLPPETRVYPGHGPPTTIAREKLSNPFVRA